MIWSTFDKQPVHGFLQVVKICPLDALEGVGKIDKTVLGGHGKNAEGARDPEPFAPGDTGTVAIIHKDQVGADFDSERDSVFFTRVEFYHGRIMHMCGLVHFSP